MELPRGFQLQVCLDIVCTAAHCNKCAICAIKLDSLLCMCTVLWDTVLIMTELLSHVHCICCHQSPAAACHCREGLVLHQLSYDDGGKQRPVLHRASLVEMAVP